MRNQNGKTLAGMLNVVFIELPKIEKLPDDLTLLTPVQMWGKFFLYASNPEKKDFITKLAEINRGIKMAVTVLKNISQDEINWYHETRYWMHVSDEKTMIGEAKRKGLAEGKKEGRSLALIEITQNALKAGLSTEQISEITGLSAEEINKLK